jgi:hypothetical protein
MKSPLNHSVKVLTTGFVVLLLLSLPLFWARWSCETTLSIIMPRESRYIRLQPSGLVPPEFENDPNVVRHSNVYADMETEDTALLLLGIADYFERLDSGGYNSNIYHLSKDREDDNWSWLYFDEKIGQIVCQYTDRQIMPDKSLRVRQVRLYAGPEGVSETADRTLGRFIQPINDKITWYRRILFLYDKKLRRFFQINFKERHITKGPELAKDDPHSPIQIGLLLKNDWFLSTYWDAPQISGLYKKERPPTGNNFDLKPIVNRDYNWHMQHLLVLDETGRIDLLDIETLEFVGSAGHLPTPETLFPSKRSVTPKDLLSYEVLPLALNTDHKHRGLFVASVNREGTSMTLAVFDEEGKLIRQENTDFTDAQRYHGRAISTSKAVYWEVPWAPTLTIAKYLLENLHPPILSLASYAMEDSIEAGVGHRALFILPNSFIAMKARDVSKNTTEKFLTALMLIFPSIILSIFLAWGVGRNAVAVGLSENARVFWILATVAFGVVSYITYILTRPKITLVTCANCGKMRRPDVEKCHRCGSRWHVPELIPPTWRVLDTTEQVRDDSFELMNETTAE